MLYINSSPQFSPGARQLSLCRSNTALSNDVFAIYGNPAGTALSDLNEFGIFYMPEPYGIKELAQYSFAYSHHFSALNVTAGFMRYGFDLLNESVISFSCSKQFFENFVAGITLNYNMLAIRNYGNDGIFSSDLGIIFSISEKIKSGFSIRNLSRSYYGKDNNSKAVIMNAGLSYAPVEDGSIYFGFEKESDFEASLSGGIEFMPVKFFVLRTGIASYPQSFSAGFGILYELFNLSYGVFTHTELGPTHFLGLIIIPNYAETNGRK